MLGSGNFAIVYRGFCGSEAVAIKKSKRTVEIDEFKAVLAEAKIMAYIGEHKHVVKFIGADVSKISERNNYFIFSKLTLSCVKVVDGC